MAVELQRLCFNASVVARILVGSGLIFFNFNQASAAAVKRKFKSVNSGNPAAEGLNGSLCG